MKENQMLAESRKCWPKCPSENQRLLYMSKKHTFVYLLLFPKTNKIESPYFYLTSLTMSKKNPVCSTKILGKEFALVKTNARAVTNVGRHWAYIYWLIKFIVKPEWHSNILNLANYPSDTGDSQFTWAEIATNIFTSVNSTVKK